MKATYHLDSKEPKEKHVICKWRSQSNAKYINRHNGGTQRVNQGWGHTCHGDGPHTSETVEEHIVVGLYNEDLYLVASLPIGSGWKSVYKYGEGTKVKRTLASLLLKEGFWWHLRSENVLWNNQALHWLSQVFVQFQSPQFHLQCQNDGRVI
jgi:hypothetical protein